MAKEGDLTREKVSILNQLAQSLREAEEGLEFAYEEKDYDKFNEAKKFMLRIQEKISEVLE